MGGRPGGGGGGAGGGGRSPPHAPPRRWPPATTGRRAGWISGRKPGSCRTLRIARGRFNLASPSVGPLLQMAVMGEIAEPRQAGFELQFHVAGRAVALL